MEQVINVVKVENAEYQGYTFKNVHCEGGVVYSAPSNSILKEGDKGLYRAELKQFEGKKRLKIMMAVKVTDGASETTQQPQQTTPAPQKAFNKPSTNRSVEWQSSLKQAVEFLKASCDKLPEEIKECTSDKVLQVAKKFFDYGQDVINGTADTDTNADKIGGTTVGDDIPWG